MEIEYDEKTATLCYIPESGFDIFRLGEITALLGWGNIIYRGEPPELEKVSFGAMGLLAYLEDNAKSSTNPNKVEKEDP